MELTRRERSQQRGVVVLLSFFLDISGLRILVEPCDRKPRHQPLCPCLYPCLSVCLSVHPLSSSPSLPPGSQTLHHQGGVGRPSHLPPVLYSEGWGHSSERQRQGFCPQGTYDLVGQTDSEPEKQINHICVDSGSCQEGDKSG